MKKQAYKYVFAINLDSSTSSGLTYDDVFNALHHLALKSFSLRGFSNICIGELSLSEKLVRTTFENNFFKVLNYDKVLPDHLTVFYAADAKAFDHFFLMLVTQRFIIIVLLNHRLDLLMLLMSKPVFILRQNKNILSNLQIFS